MQSAQVAFNYNNAQLSFGSNVLVAGTQPIQISGSIPAKLPFASAQPDGSIPAKLPFASAQPDSNQISIEANVQDEGLAVLNLLNNQVEWVNGQGEVNLQIQGTLDRPETTGIATINNAH